jgi:hypothetical protein
MLAEWKLSSLFARLHDSPFRLQIDYPDTEARPRPRIEHHPQQRPHPRPRPHSRSVLCGRIAQEPPDSSSPPAPQPPPPPPPLQQPPPLPADRRPRRPPSARGAGQVRGRFHAGLREDMSAVRARHGAALRTQWFRAFRRAREHALLPAHVRFDVVLLRILAARCLPRPSLGARRAAGQRLWRQPAVSRGRFPAVTEGRWRLLRVTGGCARSAFPELLDPLTVEKHRQLDSILVRPRPALGSFAVQPLEPFPPLYARTGGPMQAAHAAALRRAAHAGRLLRRSEAPRDPTAAAAPAGGRRRGRARARRPRHAADGRGAGARGRRAALAPNPPPLRDRVAGGRGAPPHPSARRCGRVGRARAQGRACRAALGKWLQGEGRGRGASRRPGSFPFEPFIRAGERLASSPAARRARRGAPAPGRRGADPARAWQLVPADRGTKLAPSAHARPEAGGAAPAAPETPTLPPLDEWAKSTLRRSNGSSGLGSASEREKSAPFEPFIRAPAARARPPAVI